MQVFNKQISSYYFYKKLHKLSWVFLRLLFKPLWLLSSANHFGLTQFSEERVFVRHFGFFGFYLFSREILLKVFLYVFSNTVSLSQLVLALFSASRLSLLLSSKFSLLKYQFRFECGTTLAIKPRSVAVDEHIGFRNKTKSLYSPFSTLPTYQVHFLDRARKQFLSKAIVFGVQ